MEKGKGKENGEGEREGKGKEKGKREGEGEGKGKGKGRWKEDSLRNVGCTDCNATGMHCIGQTKSDNKL